MSYTRLNPKQEKTYTGSQVATAASGYTFNSSSVATKRNGMVALTMNFSTSSAYTAGTEIKIGTIANDLKPKVPSYGFTWTADFSQFYVDTNGDIKARLGHNVSANGSLSWMRLHYMAATP